MATKSRRPVGRCMFSTESDSDSDSSDEDVGTSQKSNGVPQTVGLFTTSTRQKLMKNRTITMPVKKAPLPIQASPAPAFVIDRDAESAVVTTIPEKGGERHADTITEQRSQPIRKQRSTLDPGFDVNEHLLIKTSPADNMMKKETDTKPGCRSKRRNTAINEIERKSVIQPGFEKKPYQPPLQSGRRALRRRKKEERERTKGSDWFNLPATELNDERKKDLEVIQLRASLDPKRFYKSNDREVLPKYFQIGTVIEDPSDFYHSRVPKKERKKTIVEELLADAQFQKRNRQKYSAVMAEKAKQRPYGKRTFPKKKRTEGSHSRQSQKRNRP